VFHNLKVGFGFPELTPVVRGWGTISGLASLAIPAGRAAADEAGSIYRRSGRLEMDAAGSGSEKQIPSRNHETQPRILDQTTDPRLINWGNAHNLETALTQNT
jgi:hypothetical protein